MITIIDYGSGNLRSVSKALDHLGVRNEVTTDPGRVERAERVLLPGVGAFGACVDAVREQGFEEAIQNFLQTERPFIGICVGLQILFETSEESPEARGLGIFKGGVPRFPQGLTIPHMGWNSLERNGHESRILRDIPDEAYVYFVHSYHAEPTGEDAGAVVARSDYGVKFAAVLERDHVFATQFHPEKSQTWGLKLLKNFSEL